MQTAIRLRLSTQTCYVYLQVSGTNNTKSVTAKIQRNIVKTQNNTGSITKLSYIWELPATLLDTLQTLADGQIK